MVTREGHSRTKRRKRDEVPKSARNKKKLMAFAGVWSDIDADELIERIMRARHEAPPSDPVDDDPSD